MGICLSKPRSTRFSFSGLLSDSVPNIQPLPMNFGPSYGHKCSCHFHFAAFLGCPREAWLPEHLQPLLWLPHPPSSMKCLSGPVPTEAVF